MSANLVITLSDLWMIFAIGGGIGLFLGGVVGYVAGKHDGKAKNESNKRTK